MPYYTDNTNLIGPAKVSSRTGVHDTDYARLNPVGPAGSPAIAINFATNGTSNTAVPGSAAQYLASPGTNIPASVGYYFDLGYHYFNLLPGTYSVLIKGAEGSGTNHGLGAIINATLVVVSAARFVALVGNYGTGQYCAGGMTALALRNAGIDSYTTAIPILVAGGGGGGYNQNTLTSWGGTTANDPYTRKGLATDGPGGVGLYDGGAAFSNVYSPIRYNNVTGVLGDIGAQHFIWGGLGGRAVNCGSGVTGGFGGGGGSCPAGGGGFYGGKAGGENPSGSPGGGGTSYRLESGSIAYISTWSDGGGNGVASGNYSNTNPGSGGFLSITPV